MKIKELLDSPEHWTKGSNAKDDSLFTVRWQNPRAHSFCLVGAALRCYGLEGSNDVVTTIANEVRHELPVNYQGYDKTRIVQLFNDTGTFEKVKALVDRLDI